MASESAQFSSSGSFAKVIPFTYEQSLEYLQSTPSFKPPPSVAPLKCCKTLRKTISRKGLPTRHMEFIYRNPALPHPFKKEFASHMFEDLVKGGELKLPFPRKPLEVGMDSDPNYCPYHRCLGHTIEDCYPFKNWLFREYEEGNIFIPYRYQADV